MKICLFICSNYPPYPHGGVGSFAVDLAEGIVRAGHKVTCISLSDENVLGSGNVVYEERNGVEITRILRPFPRLPNRLRLILEKPYYCSLISALHRKEKFDLLEGEDGMGQLAFGPLPDIPKIVRLHATTIYNDYVLKRKPSRLNHMFEKLWINRANFIVAVSDYVGKTTLQLIQKDHQRSYALIYYSVDTKLFAPIPSIEVDPNLILFTGVIAPRKGVTELIKAMNIVFSINEKSRLMLIGDDRYPKNGTPFSEVIKQLIDKRYINRVLFLGSKNRVEMPSYIQLAGVCCFPSLVETFGIGVAEAMAMEKPIVFMKAGPGPELIIDGISGLLCDSHDPSDIAKKIINLLDNPEVGKGMGMRARQAVLGKFEKTEWIKRNIQFYENCIVQYH